MTHIKGSLLWTEAVFDSFVPESDGLRLCLADCSDRKMNFVNWEESFPVTKNKLEELSKGQLIKYATWNGYSEDKWFCDVEVVK